MDRQIVDRGEIIYRQQIEINRQREISKIERLIERDNYRKIRKDRKTYRQIKITFLIDRKTGMQIYIYKG